MLITPVDAETGVKRFFNDTYLSKLKNYFP